ncbi:MAG: SDR family oxidoreductase [Candidatus Binatia bacterium]
MDRLAGKIALVTGAARGIGAAIARRFRDEGAQVIVNDIDATAAEQTATALGGTALAGDVADSCAVAAMFAEVAARFGRLDVLVNNAGISGIEDAPPEMAQMLGLVGQQQAAERAAGGPVTTHLDVTMMLPDVAWHRMIAVHLDGTFFCTREALRIMAPQGSGSIVNMGSIMGTTSRAGAPHYSAAKAGILGFTRAVAREAATRNIRVNAIAPGFVATAMTAPLEGLRRLIETDTPMGRFGTPDDVAWAAVYLASDEAAFVTGQVLSPNGGYYMSQ